MNGFDVSQMNNFCDALSSEAKKFPDVAKKFMKDEAKKGAKTAKKIAKQKVKKKTGNYLKGIKAGKKVYEWNDADFNVLVQNTSPHAHLIEDGHRMFIKGKDTGKYVPGKKVMQTAAIEMQKEFSEDVENELIKRIVERIERS